MKQTIKLTTTILAVAMVVGGSGAMKAMAQTPDAIDNARSTAKSLQQKQAKHRLWTASRHRALRHPR